MSNNNQDTKQKKRIGGRVARNNNPKSYREKPSTGVSWRRASDAQQEEEIDEAEQCIICANRIQYAAISPCTHTTCHMCTFRQRALYMKKSCLICRTDNERVIITEDILKKFDDFSQQDFKALNDEYGIDFTSGQASKDTLGLLDQVCPVKYCKLHLEHSVFKNFKLLNEHVKTQHERHFCDICALNKKAFISELKLYQYRELQQHKTRGDDDGFKGHPACQFCTGKRFYSDDELFVHLREKHEKCHVCDQIDSSNPQYFKNYESLSEHFRDQHYVCNVQSCLDQKFVVFMDDFDLKAHMIKEHKNIFGGDKNLLSFGNIGYSNPRRAGFGSQLSTFPQQNTTNNNNNSNNNRGGQNRNARNNNAADDDDGEVDSMELKKMRLEERARHYLNYDAASVEKFKKVNKSYEDYKVDAEELLKTYQEIFSGLKKEDIGILVYELSELFEANSLRRKRLVEINRDLESNGDTDEQFPALPGSSSHFAFTRGSWNAPKGGSSGSSKKRIEEDFPALPNPDKPVKLNNKVISYTRTLSPASSKPKPVINRSSSNISDFKTSYLSGSKLPAASNAKSPLLNDQAFPALPKVIVKRPPRVNPIRTDSGVWGAGSSTVSSSASSPALSNNSSSLDLTSLGNSLPNNGNGKKKKKKQMLFHVGI